MRNQCASSASSSAATLGMKTPARMFSGVSGFRPNSRKHGEVPVVRGFAVFVCEVRLQHPLSPVRLLRVAETPQHVSASRMNVLGLTVGHWVVRRRWGHTKTGQVCQCRVETADESALTITRNPCIEPTAHRPFAVESVSCSLGRSVVKRLALDPLAG